MTYIFDANAVLNLTRELRGGAVELLEGESTIALASYEAGNAIWKESNLLDELDPEKASKILNFIESMLEQMEVTSLRETGLLEETLRTALEKDITYYDSAYLTVAGKKGEILVTDDENLREAAAETEVESMSSAQVMEDLS